MRIFRVLDNVLVDYHANADMETSQTALELNAESSKMLCLLSFMLKIW